MAYHPRYGTDRTLFAARTFDDTSIQNNIKISVDKLLDSRKNFPSAQILFYLIRKLTEWLHRFDDGGDGGGDEVSQDSAGRKPANDTR